MIDHKINRVKPKILIAGLNQIDILAYAIQTDTLTNDLSRRRAKDILKELNLIKTEALLEK